MIFSTAGWTGASITWTHASGSATYVVSGGDVQNAYAVAVALQAWLDDAARPWAAAISAVALAVESDGTGRCRFAYTFTGGTPTFVSITPDSTWIARFGDTAAVPPTATEASCSATPASVGWDRWDTEAGERARSGSWRWGHPALAPRQPTVDLELTLAEAFALEEALSLASQPVTAYVYDELDATWRRVTVGEYTLGHPEGDATIVTGTMDVIGGI